MNQNATDNPEVTKRTKVGRFWLLDYGRSVVVQSVSGNRDEFRESKLFGEMKDLRGVFNPNLKCGPGWIFTGNKREGVLNLLLSKVKGEEEIAKIPEFLFRKQVKEQDKEPVSRNYFEDM